MSKKVQLERCMCKVNFGYDARMDGYANLSPDMPMLSAILSNEAVIYFGSSR